MKKNFKSAFVLVLIFSVFSSCKLFNQPIDTYLKEYTENCAIMRYEYSKEYPTDDDGYVNLSSDDSAIVTCYLRNTQMITLDSKLTSMANSIAGYTFEQDTSDMKVVSLTIDKDFLYNTELNYAINNSSADITPTITLQQLNGNTVLRTFEPYQIKIKANSSPQIPEGVLVSNNSEKNTYLLCFNMCDMSGINADIESIK